MDGRPDPHSCCFPFSGLGSRKCCWQVCLKLSVGTSGELSGIKVRYDKTMAGQAGGRA
jgi:hypothetical protein